MQRQALLPLVTYPEPNSDATVAKSGRYGRSPQCRASCSRRQVDIPPVSNALSRLLLDVPEMIRQAEGLSRQRGEQLLKKVEEEAAKAGVEATTNAIMPKVALLGDAAAVHARYYDFVLCGWEASNHTSWATAEAVIFCSGRPTILQEHSIGLGANILVMGAFGHSRVRVSCWAERPRAPFQTSGFRCCFRTESSPRRSNSLVCTLADGGYTSR